jgi:hypothetical protein
MINQGVNPCATIAALAERSCDLIIQEHGWTVNESPNGILDLSRGPPSHVLSHAEKNTNHSIMDDSLDGIRFNETLKGHIHIGNDIPDFKTAAKVAKLASSSAQLNLTVDAPRNKDGSYEGSALGTFACSALSQDPLLVTSGAVDFSTTDDDVADAVNLVYKLDFVSTDGTKYGFHGYKRLDSAAAFSVSNTWSATTTLYTTITGFDGSVIGKGILRLSIRESFSELRSLQSRSRFSTLRDLYAQARFLRFFATKVASYTFSPFRSLRYPTPHTDRSGCYEKPTPTVGTLTADDGVQISIKMWHPPSGVAEQRTPIMLIPGASVDDQIFSLPTIPINAIDYFTSLGHRCYVPILRFGMGEAAKRGDTVYDARLDVRAAIQYIREREQEKQIYVIAHCLGSIGMGTALLTGDVEAHWIKGMTCSQVFIHLLLSPNNSFKARHPFLIATYKVRLPTLSSRPKLTFVTYASRPLVPMPLLSVLSLDTIPHRPTPAFLPHRQQKPNVQLERLPQMRRPLRPLLDPLQPQPRHAQASRPFLFRHPYELPLSPFCYGCYAAVPRSQQ